MTQQEAFELFWRREYPTSSALRHSAARLAWHAAIRWHRENARLSPPADGPALPLSEPTSKPS